MLGKKKGKSMNKHLVAKWFLASKEAPELGVNRCLEYIRDKNIQKEDIQQIAHSNLNVILYFWEELK
jgi:hypothetical protein